MAYGYPSGCSQADHDRAFADAEPLGDRDRDYDPLDENEVLCAAADAELCAGCGHFLPLAPDGYCGQCEPPAQEVVVWQAPAASIPWQPSTSSPRIPPRIASIGPGLFVRTGRRS